MTLSESASVPCTEGEGDSMPRTLEGVHVLCVEDGTDLRELIKMVLEQAGAAVTAVGSVAEAWESFHQTPPAIVISAIAIPQEDGYAFLRKIRALSPEQGGAIPAIALTGQVYAEDRARARSAGFHQLVPKPFEPDELVRLVASLTGRA